MISRIKIDVINCPGLQIIAFNFLYSKSKYSLFICTYLPPSRINNEVIIKVLLKVVKSLLCPELCNFGDFNFSKIDQNNPNLAFIGKPFNLNGDKTNSANLSQSLVNFLDANNLSQMVTSLTQVSGNTLVFSSHPNLKILSTLIKKSIHFKKYNL